MTACPLEAAGVDAGKYLLPRASDMACPPLLFVAVEASQDCISGQGSLLLSLGQPKYLWQKIFWHTVFWFYFSSL